MNGFLAKLYKLLQPFSLYRTKDPNTIEIEQVAYFEQNLIVMINARWIFTVMILIYGLVTLLLCYQAQLYAMVWNLGYPLLIIFFLLLAYNSWYQFSYRWFSHLRGLSQWQMLIDVIFVIFVIHYTGGVVSWVWIIYPLLVLESALVFDDPKDTWLVAASCIFFYGFLMGLELGGIIPQVRMPFYLYEHGYNVKLSLVYISWVAFIIICAALVSTYFMHLQRVKKAKLKDQIIHDPLTGLYNRKHFFYSLISEIERARRYNHIVSILLLDVDNFKKFNDRFGHLEGDKLLQGVANILKQTIEENTNLVSKVDLPFRYGGDEFAVLLPETHPSTGMEKAEYLKNKIALEGIFVVAELIRYRIEEFCAEHGHITVSIGVANSPFNGNDLETVVQAADRALYTAKRAGKNRVTMAKSQEK